MKANKKTIELLNHGFSNSLLSGLNEKQVDSLYQRLYESKKETKEVVQSSSLTYDPKVDAAELDKALTSKTYKSAGVDTTTGKVTLSMEEETSEQDSNDGDVLLAMNDPEMAVTFGAQDLGEKFESKKQQKYFWYKCGDGKTKEQKKWCKMAKEFSDSTKNFSKLPEKKKKETNEDYTDMVANVFQKNMSDKIGQITPSVKFAESKLEKKISNLVEKHLPPKMNKKDLMKMISEAEKESPVIEPRIKPDVKPERQTPQTPYQPKHKPAPKAGEKEVEIPVKPDVKPERQIPQTPYQPKHKPAPKAEDVPQWLTFGSIGINLK
jgi:hypothetical protein